MLTTFTNLPPSLEQKLRNIVSDIVAVVEPDKVICYGVRTWLKNSWSTNAPLLYSDMGAEYDLLIIPDPDKKVRREGDIVDIVNNRSKTHTRIVTLVRTLPVMNEALLQGWPFFANIYEHGILLHDSSGVPLTVPLPHNQEAYLDHIQAQWKHYYELSKKFLNGASHFIISGKAEVAIFMLHQAVEHACTALLHVFMGYRPITHSLERLLSLIKNISEEPANVFSTATRQEQELFDTLSRSYLEARYANDFKEPIEKAEVLRHRVRKLQRIIVRLYERRKNELMSNRHMEASSILLLPQRISVEKLVQNFV